MVRATNSSKRNSRKRAAPALGIAGMSLAIASGASASTAGSKVGVPPHNVGNFSLTEKEFVMGCGVLGNPGPGNKLLE